MECSTTNSDAEKFVENLITNGSKVYCDNTQDKFNEYRLPDDFNEEKFKRGQRFYHDNIFSLFVGKLSGMIVILAVPSIRNILVFTNLSSSHFTAYKRYVATIFHLHIWYTDDFKPGSTLWKSMEEVRRKHNTASRRSACAGFNRITQLDMAVTQCGLIGFAFTHPQYFGLFNPDPAAMKCWMYLWRIVGDLMGIEEQFNICRDNLEETREICWLLMENYMKPYLLKPDPEFHKMAYYLVDGLTSIHPFLDPTLSYVKLLQKIAPDSQQFRDEYAKLDNRQIRLYNFDDMIANSLNNRFWLWFNNMTIYMTLWLMQHFPFLALWRYGWRDGFVRTMIQPATTLRSLYKSS